jgi:adenylosuccinate synthase
LSKYCTFDPAAFKKEFNALVDKRVWPRFFIHPECAVTTPYDVFANRELEMAHGTCGTGFFRTKKRHFTDGVTIAVGDLWDLHGALRKVRDYYGTESVEEEDIFVDSLVGLEKRIAVTDTIPDHLHTVFEGSQGLMLDEHIGYMPHCSPSDITPRNAMEMKPLDEVWLVTRCYQTRHGNGPMTNEDHPVQLVNTEKETNGHNKYQGEFRISVLDLDQLLHAKTAGIDRIVPSSTRVNLVMTCTDQVDTHKVSVDGNFFDFHNVERFVRAIGESLKINGGLYVNTSPYSTTVREVSKT